MKIFVVAILAIQLALSQAFQFSELTGLDHQLRRESFSKYEDECVFISEVPPVEASKKNPSVEFMNKMSKKYGKKGLKVIGYMREEKSVQISKNYNFDVYVGSSIEELNQFLERQGHKLSSADKFIIERNGETVEHYEVAVKAKITDRKYPIVAETIGFFEKLFKRSDDVFNKIKNGIKKCLKTPKKNAPEKKHKFQFPFFNKKKQEEKKQEEKKQDDLKKEYEEKKEELEQHFEEKKDDLEEKFEEKKEELENHFEEKKDDLEEKFEEKQEEHKSSEESSEEKKLEEHFEEKKDDLKEEFEEKKEELENHFEEKKEELEQHFEEKQEELEHKSSEESSEEKKLEEHFEEKKDDLREEFEEKQEELKKEFEEKKDDLKEEFEEKQEELEEHFEEKQEEHKNSEEH